VKREEILLLLAFLLFVQGYLLQNVFSALMAFSIVIYLTFLRSEFSPKVEAERFLNSRLEEGSRAKSVLRLKNLSGKKLKIKIIENLPRGFKAKTPSIVLDEWEEREVTYPIIPAKGVFRIKGPTIRAMDLREMYCKDFSVKSDVEVEVYPSISKIKEDAIAEKNIRLAVEYRKFLLGLLTPEIHSLRRFQTGDDIRLIDWKATARIGEMIVKDLLREIEGDIYIILDAGKEMRKGIKNSKIDYATTLVLQLVYALRDHRVGLIVYDDFSVRCRIEASKSHDQIERVVKSLRISPEHSNLLSVKMPEIRPEIAKESIEFLRKIIPAIKGKRSFANGLIEAISHLPSHSFLIFISDISSNTSELVKVLHRLKTNHRILLLTPNPILFYDESRLNRDTLIWLYRRYIEREEIIKKLNSIVPTLDLGPSDYVDMIKEAMKR
jgi:uncharacterized protein (DUF58 family)